MNLMNIGAIFGSVRNSAAHSPRLHAHPQTSQQTDKLLICTLFNFCLASHLAISILVASHCSMTLHNRHYAHRSDAVLHVIRHRQRFCAHCVTFADCIISCSYGFVRTQVREMCVCLSGWGTVNLQCPYYIMPEVPASCGFFNTFLDV